MQSSLSDLRPERRGWRHWLARLICLVSGWRPEGRPPDAPRWICIAAPHTTNWDLFYMMVFTFWWELDIHWLGKHTIFWGPGGWFFRKLGGIQVDRRVRNNMVSRLAEIINERERIIIAIPPEGTRARRDRWKSGFYFVAKEAKIPIGLGFLDFSRKCGGFGPSITVTDDVRADMDKVRAFYATIQGKYPEKYSTIRLRQEEDAIATERAPGTVAQPAELAAAPPA